MSMLEYLEHVFGYRPHVAHERMRVARALEYLPELDEALATGELSHSAIRRSKRIAKPATAAAWRNAARGKNVREIEELVANHQEVLIRARLVRFEIMAETFALCAVRRPSRGTSSRRVDDHRQGAGPARVRRLRGGEMSHVGPGSISSTFETVKLRTKAHPEILIQLRMETEGRERCRGPRDGNAGPDAPIDKIIFEASRALR